MIDFSDHALVSTGLFTQSPILSKTLSIRDFFSPLFGSKISGNAVQGGFFVSSEDIQLASDIFLEGTKSASRNPGVLTAFFGIESVDTKTNPHPKTKLV